MTEQATSSPDVGDLDPFEQMRVHVMSRIGMHFREPVDDGGVPTMILPESPALCDDDGHLQLGVLAIALDMASSTGLGAEQRRPFLHSDISIHRHRPPTGPVTVEATALRVGGRTAVVEADVRDADDALVAHSTQQLVFSGQPAHDVAEDEELRQRWRSVFDGAVRLDAPLTDVLGIVESVPGTWEMAWGLDRINGTGGLHGGTAITLIDAAVAGAATGALGRPARTVSVAVRYLRLAQHGPFRARPEVLGRSGDLVVARVAVHDVNGELVMYADAHATG